jgi:hypothetical protein
MERRRFRRKIVSLKAELISGGVSYLGVIENLSEEGIYMRIAPTKNAIDFVPGTKVELRFQPSSEETLNLPCSVKWAYKTPPHGLTTSIGMEIINPPPEYKEFLETL